MKNKWHLFIASIIFGVFLFVGVSVLPHYGQNWDEAAHFFRGQAFLNFFLTGKKNFKDLPKFSLYHQKDDTVFLDAQNKEKKDIVRRSMYQYDGLGFAYWTTRGGGGHPPLSDIFSALFNYVFFQKLGLINDVDSYHLYSIFLSAALVAVIYLWVRSKYGGFSALVASISLALYPLFLGESHFNIKDPPETVFYSLAIITFYEAVVRRNSRWMILSSIFSGFAFATKFNVVFLPVILTLWLVFIFIGNKDRIKSYFSLTPSVIIYPVVVFAIFFVSWPFLWSDPLENFKKIVGYYKAIGTNTSFDPSFLWYLGINTYAVQRILFSTPIIILMLSSIGIFYSLKHGLREKWKISFLVLLWFALPIVRVTMPGAGIYGGVRQIMEFIPAMAILSGIGAAYIVGRSKGKRLNLILKLLIIVSFIPLTMKFISLHPNEGLYFNSLIGGFKGAMSKNFLDANYDLGNPYKQAIVWANNNLEKDAKLALFSGLGSDIPGTQLREDIKFFNGYRSGFERRGEYVMGLMENVRLDSYSNSFIYYYYNEFLNPVHEIKVEGIPIVKFWKNDREYAKPEYRSQSIIEDATYKLSESDLTVILQKPSRITKVNIYFTKEKCDLTTDGSVEVFLDSNWLTLDNQLIVSGFNSTFYNYKSASEFVYPIAAIKTDKIRFTFLSPKSCFREHVSKVTVYGLPDLKKQ